MNREEAIDILKCDISADKQGIEYCHDALGIEALDMAIKALQEQKTGHWCRKTKVDAYDIAGVKTWGIKCQCDRCDFATIVVEDFGYYTYCPNCGARMVEPKKSCNTMEFPDTFDEFAKDYGFKDSKEVYTNDSDLIPVFRVKQWLEHIESQESKKIYCHHTDAEISKAFIEDVEAVKDLLPKAESKDNCNTCIHYKPNNLYCECCFNLDKYESEE